jgi:hypothetical protein
VHKIEKLFPVDGSTKKKKEVKDHKRGGTIKIRKM